MGAQSAETKPAPATSARRVLVHSKTLAAKDGDGSEPTPLQHTVSVDASKVKAGAAAEPPVARRSILQRSQTLAPEAAVSAHPAVVSAHDDTSSGTAATAAAFVPQLLLQPSVFLQDLPKHRLPAQLALLLGGGAHSDRAHTILADYGRVSRTVQARTQALQLLNSLLLTTPMLGAAQVCVAG
jgi:hypothetical protein